MVALVSPDEPGVSTPRAGQPLVFGSVGRELRGLGHSGLFALHPRGAFLEDGELVRLDANSWQVVRRGDLSPVDKPLQTLHLGVSRPEGRQQALHAKEIFEQPRWWPIVGGRVDCGPGACACPSWTAWMPPRR
jgi:glucosamine--fructose-6-phosphate aminotransferase (isomerizing)